MSSLTTEGAIRFGDQPPEFAGGGGTEIFSDAELEQLAYRRFNPLKILTAETLTQALDAFDCGILINAAKLWQVIAERDDTIKTAKGKREEAVALRDWTVTPLDDSPEAKDQAAALEFFYKNVRATHALKRHVLGKFPLLATQMMGSTSFGYTSHHIIWQPNPKRTLTLPSGKVVPTLTATFEEVPLEFFEARTGQLRFLGLSLGYTGEPLAPGDWMVTTGPCLMQAASILYYFNRLAKHDLINFSEQFGQPGIVVHTTAAKGSPEGEAARNLSRRLSSNYRGVIYGAAENKNEIVWPSGGASGTNLPMHVILEDGSRAITTLFLGADLSTMSRGGSSHGIGASVQEDAQEKRERADCARLSETLQLNVDTTVLEWFFGEGCDILAEVEIESPVNEDRALLGNLVVEMVGLGVKVPVRPVMKRLNVPVANDGEDVFTPPAAPQQPLNDTQVAVNVGSQRASASEAENKAVNLLLARSRDLFGESLAEDFQPLRTAFEKVLEGDDTAILTRADALYGKLGELGPEIIAANGSPDALLKILSTAAANGLADQTHASV